MFDGDDTLWEDQSFYEKAWNGFKDTLGSLGFDPDYAVKKLNEVDLASVGKFGFSSERFPTSMVITYGLLCKERGLVPNVNVEKRVFDIGSSVFTEQRELFPHVRETLQNLSRSGHSLILFTAGDREVQERKVRSLKLEELFDAVVIIDRKDVDTYKATIERLHLDVSRTFMVGNSLKSDVLAPLDAGIMVIYVPRETWAYELEDKRKPEAYAGRYLEAKSIREVPGAISQMLVSAGKSGKNVIKSQ